MADDAVCIATPQPEMGVIEGESVNGHGGEEAPGGECAFREEAGPDFIVEADAEGSRETQRDSLHVKQGDFKAPLSAQCGCLSYMCANKAVFLWLRRTLFRATVVNL